MLLVTAVPLALDVCSGAVIENLQVADELQLGDRHLPLFSDAYLIYGSHLLSGRLNPESIDPEWIASRRERDLVAALEVALALASAGSGRSVYP